MRYLAFYLCMIILSTACHSERPEVNTKLSSEEVNELLNQRRYLEIIQVLEPRDPAQKISEEDALSLIYAHLGAINFRVLNFASSVLQEQMQVSEYNEKLFPSCPHQQINFDTVMDEKCLVGRILQNLPDVKSRHFLRAQELFREYFRDGAVVANEINFLGGVVELLSFMGALKEILIFEGDLKNKENIKKISIIANKFLVDLSWFYKRASNSYAKINHWLLRLNNISFLKERGMTVEFIENSLIPELTSKIEKIESAQSELEIFQILGELTSIVYEK
jgi:hypothetical protein